MNKHELAGYLCNLQTIMEGKEDAGRPRGRTLAFEYERTYEELISTLRKEKEDAEREKAGTNS